MINMRNLKAFSVIIFLFTAVLSSIFLSSKAYAKEYSYDLITTFINVNADSTFDVEEQQIYNYTGNYNQGWRSVSLNKTDGISDIQVLDGQTGEPLIYSSSRLDKLSPSSWGKFTYYKSNGEEDIEWYYNLSDTKHKWVIRYKVHGGIGFLSNSDELYWNLFSSYDVPIKKALAYVKLPDGIDSKDVTMEEFRTGSLLSAHSFLSNGKTIYFEAYDFNPREVFTVKIGWPKGFVSESAYWMDFLKIYGLYVLAALITLINLLFIFFHWFFREKYKKGKGTIIPQYAPPENLKPAMAEVIIKEGITDKAWSATVIDLAVRGYIKIKEDKADWLTVAGNLFLWAWIIVVIISFFLIGSSVKIIDNGLVDINVLLIIIFGCFIFYRMIKVKGGLKGMFIPKEYILERLKPNDGFLEDYEKQFLTVILEIFGSGGVFSTKKMKHADNMKKRGLYSAMQSLKEDLYKETNKDTQAFENGVENEKTGGIILFISLFIFIFIFSGSGIMSGLSLLIALIILNSVVLFVYLEFEARLNEKGFILKEEWLGFKMYLETAERYRMQNLTPDTFERYLPYAIILGVEKQWGKAFESFNMPPPSWYGGYMGAGVYSGGDIGGGPVSNFSPSAFSTSFSSSFSSAFASSGGGGGGGGGGGAGGGGGGGGGGAS
jgi:uncharacterized membrane protein YgcG